MPELVRSRADRVRADVVAVVLDHLARQRAGDAAVREVVDEDIDGLVELDLPRVAVEGLDPLEGRVVVDAVVLAGLGGERGAAGDVALHFPKLRGAHLRIEEALERVDVIVRRELALPSLERGIVVEEDPRLHAHRVGEPVGADLRHGLERLGLELRRARNVVVLERRVEHRVVDDVRIHVAHRVRVEARLRDLERIAEDLVRVGRGRGPRQRCRNRKNDLGEAHETHGRHCNPGNSSLSADAAGAARTTEMMPTWPCARHKSRGPSRYAAGFRYPRGVARSAS